MSRNWLLIVQSDFWQFFRMRYRKIKSKIELLRSISNMYVVHLPIWIIILQRISWFHELNIFFFFKHSDIFLNIDIWKTIWRIVFEIVIKLLHCDQMRVTPIRLKKCLTKFCLTNVTLSSFSSVFITYFDELFVHICRKLE